MSGPWEKYAAQPAQPAASSPSGPWEKYAAPAPSTPAAPDYHAEASAYLDAHPEAQHGFGANMLERFGQGASLGFVDEAMAGVAAVRDSLKHGGSLSDNYAREKAMTEELSRRSKENTGAAGTAAEIAGSFAPGIGIASGVGKVIANPLAQSVATGAVMGGGQAAGDGENIAGGALLGAGGGAIGHGLGKLVGKGIDKIAGTGPAAPAPVQTPDMMKAEAQNLFKRFETSGGNVTKQGADDLHAALTKTMSDAGVRPGFSPKFDSVLNELNRLNPGTGSPAIGASDLQGLRQTASLIAQSIDPAERRIGHQMVGAVDDFLAKASPDQFTGGMGAQHASGLLKDANQAWTKYSKADMVDRAMTRAQQQAERSGSGGNIQNTIRQKVGGLGDKRSWSPAEQAQIDKISSGTPVQNLLRLVGKMSPEGNGLMQAANVGAGLASGGSTVPLSLLGLGAKRMADNMGRNQVTALQEIIANGGVPTNVNLTPGMVEAFLSKVGGLTGGAGPGAVE